MNNENGLTIGWRERIKDKKVIFYNTGVSGLLSENEKHIRKMDHVFDEFKKHSDVVLWWRPHPLELTTINSMRPDLRELYLNTRKRFIDENIGILDESSDLNRAIAVSDAYYGTYSSVVQLFIKVNKPVIYSNSRYIRSADEYLPLTYIADICEADGHIYAVPSHYGIILKMNNNFEVTGSIELEKEFNCFDFLFSRIFFSNRKLILMPCFGCNIVLYDIDSKKTDYIKCGELNVFKNFDVVSEDNNLMVILQKGGGQFFLLDTEKITLNPLTENAGLQLGKIFFSKNTMYATEKNGRRIFSINAEKKTINIVYNGYESDSFSVCCAAVNDTFVLAHSDKKQITLLNMLNGERKEITDFPSDFAFENNIPYEEAKEYNGKVFFFPAYSNMMLVADPKDETIKAFGSQCRTELLEEFDNYHAVKFYGNKAVMFATLNNRWDILDLGSGELTNEELVMSRETQTLFSESKLFDNSNRFEDGAVYEKGESLRVTIARLIKSIASYDPYNKGLENMNVGSMIHSEIKRFL